MVLGLFFTKTALRSFLKQRFYCSIKITQKRACIHDSELPTPAQTFDCGSTFLCHWFIISQIIFI